MQRGEERWSPLVEMNSSRVLVQAKRTSFGCGMYRWGNPRNQDGDLKENARGGDAKYPRRAHLYQWGCISLLLFASPPRAFSFKSPSWWRGLPQRSISTSKGCSLCLHQYPRRVHLYQWGCISLLLFASPPRAFSFKSPSWWRGLPQRSIPRPKDVLFACTSTPEEFISTSGAASLFSSLHLLRVHSLLNPHPDDVDYLSDPYHIQRMFSLLAPVPQKSSSLPVGLHLSSPLCISSACILF